MALREVEHNYCGCKDGDSGCKRLQNIFSYNKCFEGYEQHKKEFKLPTHPLINVSVISSKQL